VYRGCLGRRRRQFQETVVVAGYESCSVAALLSLQPVLLIVCDEMSRHSNVVVGSRRVVFDARRVICSWYNEMMASFHVYSRVTFAVEANARMGVVSTSDVLSCCSGILLYTAIHSNLDCCSG
jgi:hypothetical protein